MANGTQFDEYQSVMLTTLADGELHSGQEIANKLGVSRTAVWKHLQKLEAAGIALETVKGKGYRIVGGLELLDAATIQHHLPAHSRALLTRLEVLASASSTNDQVLSQARQAGSGYVCLAEQQTAGRGRRGRQWISPFGKNIYLSAGWEYEGGAAVLEGLSLAVGVAIVKAFSAAGIPGVQLKWPNDVLWQGKKLAGVLLEMSGDASGRCYVVVGIGINVEMSEHDAKDISQQWVDLHSIARENSKNNPGRNLLAALLIEQLFSVLESYAGKRFVAYKNDWQALNAFSNQPVILTTSNETFSGKMSGVTDAGALVLDCDGQEKVFYGGEVSLRGVSGDT
ncbi:bifunctional biotin--[acetyl-CoA-carboxylase] ligase/biotin operon repressor BirA [Cellvibrio polysaccharolyticus]|nr:bifunctional biotin--[acetyl-CoA-carboxylase] ligase/biotin operon repressor BirA [Cellvibrio polysaccharolyticus]